MASGKYYVVDQIEKAFFDLMAEKDYADITVTDVIKKAQVSRASFYRHFSSTSEIIDNGMKRMFGRYTETILPTLISSDEKKMREFLYTYADKNLEMQRAMAAFLPLNSAVIYSRAMNYLQDDVLPNVGLPADEKYRLSARTGVINNILAQWIAGGRKESTEEIVDCIMGYLMLF